MSVSRTQGNLDPHDVSGPDLTSTHASGPRKLVKVNNKLHVVRVPILGFNLVGLVFFKRVVKAGIPKLVNNSIMNMLSDSMEAPNCQRRLGGTVRVVIPLSDVQEKATDQDCGKSTELVS